MSRRVTLRDVAQHVGVSVTTVSNVVRGWPYVADETRHKVQVAVAELGYSPHLIAQSLRTGQMHTLGFIVPDLGNPYFAAMVSVAADIAQEASYSITIFDSQEDAAKEAECIQRATKQLVDGVLVAQVVRGSGADYAQALPVPVVWIDRVPPGYDGPACRINNARVAELAVGHLVALGHRRIAHLGGPVGVGPAEERCDGYARVLAEHGLSYHRVVRAGVDWTCDDGYARMRELLADAEPPTAVFASNDGVAIGAMHAVRDAGLRVPDHISIIGVDDIDVSQHLDPALTTVRQPLDELARAGIELLLKLVHGEAADARQVMLEPTLVVRGSTARPA